MTIQEMIKKIEALIPGVDSLELWKEVLDDNTKEYYGELCTPDEIADLKALAAAVPQWIPIRSKSDLPKERGCFLVRTHDRLSMCRNYLPEAPSVVREWLEEYRAYMPIPPYKPTEAE